MNAARDTRTLGQRRFDGRSGWTCKADRRHNRELRPVLRVNWRAARWYVFALGVSTWLASPEARPLWMAIWGQP